ncbi:MAG: GAF domain-containing protein [Candidatus Dormibacteraeota bacterium]|uniref:histidine kinase n=1 Tax=Candidatus Dormiibacter inghamiae TaxID=3127013 RepID=A0A934KKH6_9BACT|nr:GAF domain-containing protein [Candidatus Dormibacteraeota bacterium]MBJ7607257.1 GAF domain-containing protein [Candidatus Dormibacteraeota bacterium]
MLNAHLRPLLGYDVFNLQVLEREGWYHNVVMDSGVLQDVGRYRLVDSYFLSHYRSGRPSAGHFADARFEHGRGSGAPRRPQTYIWMPILHHQDLVGAVIYQLFARRSVPPEEMRFLGEVHAQLGVLVSNAYLNELTRNQALSLSALNEIGCALAVTRDELGIVGALRETLGPRVPLDQLELVLPQGSRARVLTVSPQTRAAERVMSLRSSGLATARAVLSSGQSLLEPEARTSNGYPSAALVPVKGSTEIEAVLTVKSREPDVYEHSTLAFLGQVADQVALALSNARSYAALEANRHHLEVVEAVGRELATRLDPWMIVRTLQAELSRHVAFDSVVLAVLEGGLEGPVALEAGLEVPVAHSYAIDLGRPQPPATIPLAGAGPAREAFRSGRPVLADYPPWTSGANKAGKALDGAPQVALQETTGSRRARPARSVLWVPVRQEGRIRALLSIQSYRQGAFSSWHTHVLQDVATHVGLALSNAQLVEALDRQATTLGTILANTPIGVMLEGADGRITFANPALERLYGVEAKSLEGARSERLLDLAGGAGSSEVDPETGATSLVLKRNGLNLRIQRLMVPASRDHPAGVLTLHEDVTRQRAAEEERDLMLRAIGHELRSPAAAIRGLMASLLQWDERLPADERRAALIAANDQSERLLRVVEAQLLIARLERDGPADAAVEDVDFCPAVRRVVQLLSHAYEKAASVVVCDEKSGSMVLRCEPAHLQQVLTNLIGNALEHAACSRVEVRANRAAGWPDWCEVTVSDDGTGLPEDLLAATFNQSRAGRHRAMGGLGIGLHLSRLVVERSFGGQIWLAQHGPRGTAISFTVPCKSPSKAEKQAVRHQAEKSVLAGGDGQLSSTRRRAAQHSEVGDP